MQQTGAPMTEPKPEIAPRIENGDALCVAGCPRLTIANGKILSACATTAQYGGYCGPWYREQVAALRPILSRVREWVDNAALGTAEEREIRGILEEGK